MSKSVDYFDNKVTFFQMMKSAILVGIGFFGSGIFGLIIAALFAPHAFCLAACTSRYEDLLIKFAVRTYGLISMGIGSLFVIVGALGNTVQNV